MQVDTRLPTSPSVGPSSLESVSDTEDWLEIGESESDFTSSRSRTSSISLSSGSEHAEVWEGLVDGVTAPSSFTSATERETTPGRDEVDTEEAVKAALDQSMVGTLSTSRSSSYGLASTAQSSHRDLKLSFPDPLTSSLTGNDFNATLRSSRTKAPLSPPIHQLSSAVLVTEPCPISLASSSTSLPDSEVGAIEHVNNPPPPVVFEIHLYGCSSPPRWSAVSALIRKANYGSGRGLISTHIPENHTRHYHVETNSLAILSIAVHDHAVTSPSQSQPQSTCPSLAIVCLPISESVFVPEHTFYLPVIVTLDQESELDQDSLVSDWQALEIPEDRRLALTSPRGGGIVTDEEILQLDGTLVDDAMRPLIGDIFSSTVSDNHSELISEADIEKNGQLKGIISMSLAIMIAACVLSTFLGSQVPPTRTFPEAGSWKIVPRQPTNETTASKSGVIETSLMASSFKDYALAVFNPGASSSSAVPLGRTLNGSTAAKGGPSTSSGPAKVSQELSLRPSGSLSPSVSPSKQKVVEAVTTPSVASTSSLAFVAPVETKALNLRFVDSLSRIYDHPRVKEVMECVDESIAQVTDAIDESITQVTNAIDKFGVALSDALTQGFDAVEEEMQYRNARATKRAKDISDRGWKEWRRATRRAKENARAMKKEAKRRVKDKLGVELGFGE